MRIDPALEPLIAAARQAAQNSYSPYSRFRVGAAIELTNGAIVTGTNVENVSYGLTICAEAAAIARTVPNTAPPSASAPSPSPTSITRQARPAVHIRQLLAEFIEPDAPVAFAAEDGLRTMPFRDLLPLVFKTTVK